MDSRSIDERIRELTEATRAYKRATGRNPATDELGELQVCRLLSLELAPPNTEGYDAFDADRLRVQVKARAPRTEAHVHPAGRVSRFSSSVFDYALLILFDGEVSPEQIVRAERDALQPLQAKIPGTSRGLHVSTFLRVGRVVWRRE